MRVDLIRPTTPNPLSMKETNKILRTGTKKFWFYCQHPAGFIQFLEIVHADSLDEAKEKLIKCLPGLNDLEKRTMTGFDKQQKL